MLCALADDRKMLPFVIIRRKTMPKEKVPAGLIIRAQKKGCMTKELVIDWLNVVWNRRPDFCRRRGECWFWIRLEDTSPKKGVIAKCNTDLVVIPGAMTSQL